MELNREQIIQALECFHSRILNSNLAEKITEGEIMSIINALALIKELTEENKNLTINMNAYGLTAKRLAEENEKLHASCTELTQCCTKLETLYKIECKRVDTIKDDTLRNFAERIKRYYNSLNGRTPAVLVAYHIDQIKEEMLRRDSDDNT